MWKEIIKTDASKYARKLHDEIKQQIMDNLDGLTVYDYMPLSFFEAGMYSKLAAVSSNVDEVVITLVFPNGAIDVAYIIEPKLEHDDSRLNTFKATQDFNVAMDNVKQILGE